MGAKQSAEVANQRRTQSLNNHRNHSSGRNGVSSSHQSHSTVTVGSLAHNARRPRPMLRFSSQYMAETNSGQLEPRLARTNSAVESGMQIPRSGFEWFYAQQQNSDDSSPEQGSSTSRVFSQRFGRHNVSNSLPHYLLSSARDAKCSMCNKMIPAEDVEIHFVMCLTKPRVTYNEDVLSTTSGECAICLEDLEEGEAIARLPCLCVYHKVCIDQWFAKSQTCPEHPPD